MKDNVLNTGNWDVFTSLEADQEVNLTAGEHTIRLLGAGTHGWVWNMDRFILERVSDMKRAASVREPLTGMTVYPNPASDVLYISFATGFKNSAQLVLYNSMGDMVTNGQISSGVQELSIGNLPSGMYILQVTSEGAIETKRFIKK